MALVLKDSCRDGTPSKVIFPLLTFNLVKLNLANLERNKQNKLAIAAV